MEATKVWEEQRQAPLIKKYSLTIPIELLEKIEKEANQQNISLNKYILNLINQNIK